MCLIGIIYPRGGGYLLFKNRDLEYRPILPEPSINSGACRYIAFPSADVDQTSIWGGVNEHGLTLQFADAYTNQDSDDHDYEPTRKILRAWHYDALTQCATVHETLNRFLRAHADTSLRRLNQFALFADPHLAVMVECVLGEIAIEWLSDDHRFLLRTHWPIQLARHAPIPWVNRNVISALARYQRALELLKGCHDPTLSFITALICNSAYGQTDLSVRRVAPPPLYQTVASLIVECTSTQCFCHYVLNKPPDVEAFRTISIAKTPQPTCSG